jgi:hypothetical protein
VIRHTLHYTVQAVMVHCTSRHTLKHRTATTPHFYYTRDSEQHAADSCTDLRHALRTAGCGPSALASKQPPGSSFAVHSRIRASAPADTSPCCVAATVSTAPAWAPLTAAAQLRPAQASCSYNSDSYSGSYNNDIYILQVRSGTDHSGSAA